MPGYTELTTWFEIRTPGNYIGQCAFLCGRGHARMKADGRDRAPAGRSAWPGSTTSEAQITAANAAQQAARAQQQQRRPARAVGRRCAEMATTTLSPRSRRSSPTSVERAAARPGQLADDDRPQADRDPLHGHDVGVLHPRRRRGADDAPAARAWRTTTSSRPRSTTSSSRCTARRWSSSSSCR